MVPGRVGPAVTTVAVRHPPPRRGEQQPHRSGHDAHVGRAAGQQGRIPGRHQRQQLSGDVSVGLGGRRSETGMAGDEGDRDVVDPSRSGEIVAPPDDAEVERAIASVPGVTAATLRRDPDSGRTRLRLRLRAGEDAEQAAWSIAATLRERFGIALDPDSIRPISASESSDHEVSEADEEAGSCAAERTPTPDADDAARASGPDGPVTSPPSPPALARTPPPAPEVTGSAARATTPVGSDPIRLAGPPRPQDLHAPGRPVRRPVRHTAPVLGRIAGASGDDQRVTPRRSGPAGSSRSMPSAANRWATASARARRRGRRGRAAPARRAAPPAAPGRA
jgi:hypothetical protein